MMPDAPLPDHPAPAIRPAAAVVLPVIILMLLGSAGLRLAAGAGQAIAQTLPAAPATVPPAAVPAAALPAADTAATETVSLPECPTDPQLNDILARLSDREARLSDRTAELSAREVTLQAAEARLSQRIDELQRVEARLTETMAQTAVAAREDVGSLVAVYSAMKPKEAAELFEAMSPDFAAGFLRLMRPETAAPILAALSPTHAYAVSAVLAGRNVDVPVPQTPAPALESDRG